MSLFLSENSLMRSSEGEGDCKLKNYRNSGNWSYRIRRERARSFRRMKNLKRYILGALSTLLFAIGFARAADQLDPMSKSVSGNTDTLLAGAPDSSSYCDVMDSNP